MLKIKGLDKDFVEKELKWWNIPGAAVCIVRGEESITAGYGVRKLPNDASESSSESSDKGASKAALKAAPKSAPMTPDTLGGIASCSKAFTGFVLASLADEGRIDLDQPIKEYVPEFAMMDPVAQAQCTVRDLLYHRTGLAPHDAMWPNPDIDRREYIRRIGFLEPNRPFRYSSQYNNTVYNLAGAIAEVVSGQTWEELVQERIFKPLGMRRSMLSAQACLQGKVQDVAIGYFGPERESKLERMEPWEMDVGGPAAGVITCASDMVPWLQMHMHGGVYKGKRLLSEAMCRDMHHGAVVMSSFPWRFPEVPGMTAYGMGWKSTIYRGKVMVYHCGEIEGYSIIQMFLPDEDFGMFAYCNRHKPVTPFLLELVYTAIDENIFGENHRKIDWAERLHPYATVFEGSCDDWVVNALPEGYEEACRLETPMTKEVLHAYAGEYFHLGYGKLSLSADIDAGKLLLHYKKWVYPLEGGREGKFIVRGLKEDTLYYTIPLVFLKDEKGFRLLLEPSVEAIEFKGK